MYKIGLIREYKEPADRRVAFTPYQCLQIQKTFTDIEIIVESSPDRIFKDNLYTEAGIKVSNDLSACDILFGIKEVPAEHLIPNKTYLFFSHTIKKQPHNQRMLASLVQKNIRLIDYECLKWHNGSRVLGFGRYAGLVGTYEAFKAIGLKYRIFELKPASQYQNFEEIKVALLLVESIIKKQKLKIVLTGSGRVSSGCKEILKVMKIEKISPSDFLKNNYSETIYTLLESEDLYARNDGGLWNHEHFFKNHKEYTSRFKPYTFEADVLINGVFWDSAMPQHFSKADTKLPAFKIRTIADISCDIEGSVPITVKETHADEPVYGWDILNECVCAPYTENCIDIMAVSNLPTELPADASEGFGNDLITHILPKLLSEKNDMIEKATICKNGRLTENYLYLSDYIKS